MDMKISSDLGKFQSHVEEVEEYCAKHNSRKALFYGKGPFCLECSKEKKEVEEKEMLIRMTSTHENKAEDWLRTRSIFADKRLNDATIDNYLADEDETLHNKEMAKTIARGYYKGATYNSILSGVVGAGKSHLAISILKLVNEFSDPPKKCLFIALDELLKRIRESFDDKNSPHTEAAMIKMLSEADLIVLDDLGAETSSLLNDKTATDFTTRILYAIFNGRSEKPTIITTNLNSKGIARMYDERLVSRMFRGADGHVIKFKTTKDKRKTLEF